MWPDPDGLELQLFQPPAGLVTAAVKSPLPVPGDGLVTPRGVDHMLLRVSSLEKALPYYRMVYGSAAERPRDAAGRVWFHLDRDTRLALQQANAGQPPTIEHYAIKVAPFDRAAVSARLRELGVRTFRPATNPTCSASRTTTASSSSCGRHENSTTEYRASSVRARPGAASDTEARR
jgi:hypothetical protein